MLKILKSMEQENSWQASYLGMPWELRANHIQDGSFRAAHGWVGEKGLLSKICPTYPTMMKPSTVIPHLKKIQKYINHVTHFLSITDIIIFSPEISNFCCIKKYRCRLHFNTLFLILSSFFELLKVFLINMVVILMISEKLATP